jgi:hypothetical protein
MYTPAPANAQSGGQGLQLPPLGGGGAGDRVDDGTLLGFHRLLDLFERDVDRALDRVIEYVREEWDDLVVIRSDVSDRWTMYRSYPEQHRLASRRRQGGQHSRPIHKWSVPNPSISGS